MAPDDASPPAPGLLLGLHHKVLAYWDATGLPALAARGRVGGLPFRFTEGPPTANGAPHVGHLLARTLKDTQLRYRRMRGYEIVTPMAGWDCHGLPVEIEVEKRHGFRSKREIEAYGIERFCEECRASTLAVAALWESMSRRMGYWLDYERPYLTMAAPYIESVWWSLKTLFDKGLLEKGYRVLPYCPRCETSLSSHEVAQGYRETTDPSVTVRFPVRGSGSPPRSLLVWTTTPWTLPSNLLVAARADLEYVGVAGPDGGERILATAALPRYFPQGTVPLAHYRGRDLAGWEYEPPFPFAGPGTGRYRVVLDDMVDAAEGTGLVHIAPSYGPEDQRIGEREGVGRFDPLDGRAHFTDAVPLVQGKAFKAADPVLTEALAAAGRLERTESLRHTYPFCWRCANPLLYRALDSWFVRTSKITDALVRNNRAVTWVPAYLRDGRFGNFLEEAKDWALSRSRYWGTPLPVWTCPDGHRLCVGSFAELAAIVGGTLPEPFDPHRVAVDRLDVRCPTCRQSARREPYTIDGWYDSGAAPFAQYHYPFEPGPFAPERPLDYVAEGLDQTRGWFYTLLVLATALFDRPAYTACLTNGLGLDERGLKMSKSKGNVVDPLALLERLGGDGPRWAFLLMDYTESFRVDDAAMAQAANRTLGTLAHATDFYRQNAAADGLRASTERPTPTAPLDRWLLSRLEATREAVTESLDRFDPRAGALALREFVDDLSTWYLRRSRPRFWSDRDPADRRAADATLSFALATTARLLAPYAPFTAEHVAQQLDVAGFVRAETSVHLAAWPEAIGPRDLALEAAMAALRAEVEIGRALRHQAGVKARIPLERFVLVDRPRSPALADEADRLLAEELNVLAVERVAADALGRFPEEAFARDADATGRVRALLSRRPTPELAREGLVREALRRLQAMRKEAGLEPVDRIRLAVFAEGGLREALEAAAPRVAEELLADALELLPAPPPEGRSWEIAGDRMAARLERARR